MLYENNQEMEEAHKSDVNPEFSFPPFIIKQQTNKKAMHEIVFEIIMSFRQQRNNKTPLSI